MARPRQRALDGGATPQRRPGSSAAQRLSWTARGERRRRGWAARRSLRAAHRRFAWAAALPGPGRGTGEVSEPRRHVARRARWQGGAALQGPRAQRRAAGGARSARSRCCAVPAPPGPRAGGSSGRLGLRRRQCPRDGAVQRRRHRDGSGGWSRPWPAGAAGGSGLAVMESGPSGETGALACGIRSPLSS